MYDQVIKNMKIAYELIVNEREARELVPWKAAEREDILALLQREGKHKLLEFGAGTGMHGRFFQDNGLDVICTDLSPKMIASCRKRI
jgi:cyclopropane fatty-acyl-phospholipid synthase-like methyltransferase